MFATATVALSAIALSYDGRGLLYMEFYKITHKSGCNVLDLTPYCVRSVRFVHFTRSFFYMLDIRSDIIVFLTFPNFASFLKPHPS